MILHTLFQIRRYGGVYLYGEILTIFLQDLAVDNYIKIRGLEINGNLFINLKAKRKDFGDHSINFSVEKIVPNNVTGDVDITRMKTVHSTISSTFSKVIQSTAYILPLSLLCLLLLISIIVSIGVCRYLRLRKGSYYTEEDAGDTQAGDADTAVLQGKTGHRVERRREWIL